MDLTGLNSEQRKAVKQIEGPLLILAGAGSGKTTTMTHRIAYMIESGIPPYSILAVTFTNKAAGEMRERVESLVDDTRGMWIMTFHAMCLRILRYHCETLGYRNGFTIYDEGDKRALIKKIMKEMDVDEKTYPVSMLTGVISRCKEREEDPDTYLERYAGEYKTKTIYEIYRRYMAELMRNNAMDFDDLLWNGVRLLESEPRVLDHYSSRFTYIMVDEYQDTNYLQYKLIQLLAGKNRNLCVVGDDDQCIYEWRGADIRNILDFEKDFPEAKTIKLEQNYRSDANILALANSVIQNNKGRKRKALWTDREDGEKITYRRLEDEKTEAWYVGGEIDRLHSEGYAYSDMAVLYRKNAQSRPFEEKFSFRGIPYRVLAGTRFYDRMEIKDMMAYLKLIENPDDDVAMLRVINEPKRGVGAKSLAGITSYARSYGTSIYGALKEPEVMASLSARARKAVGEFLEMIRECGAEKENMDLGDLYDNVMRRSGYLKALEDADTVEADARIENIMEFRSVISEFEKKLGTGEADDPAAEAAAERESLRSEGFEVEEPSALSEFLEQIALMSDIDNRDENEDAVVLMTLHSAKGLEFPVVFMPGMENGLFPVTSAFDDESKMEEERRLCYVGITRAKKKLYLTGAKMRMMYGRTDYAIESDFLGEMDSDLLEGDMTAKDREELGGGLFGEEGVFGERGVRGRFYGSADGFSGNPAGKPFDQLGYARKSASRNISNEGFEVGDRLRHPKFGEGMLIEQDEKTMTVIFDSVGLKKLGKGFVRLEKVD
jgi:DNA helicase-2/ATP-dependent DNA helicase PcrA